MTLTPAVAGTSSASKVDLRRLQRRTLTVLAAAQVAGGIGVAIGVALGSLIVAELSGSVAISGFAAGPAGGEDQ